MGAERVEGRDEVLLQDRDERLLVLPPSSTVPFAFEDGWWEEFEADAGYEGEGRELPDVGSEEGLVRERGRDVGGQRGRQQTG